MALSVDGGAQSKPVGGVRPRVLRVLPVLAGMLVCFVGVQLGNWQLRRADEKTDLGARITALAAAPAAPLSGPDAVAQPAEWQRVRLAGEWLPEGAIFLDNRVHDGRPGYHLLEPLRLEGSGDVVLVNRGWVAAAADRAHLPELAGGRGAAEVEGVVRHPDAQAFTLASEAGTGRLWQVLDLEAYRRAFRLPVADFVVQQTSAEADGLMRDWPRPDSGVDRHRGYAVQWYGLAAAAAAMTAFHVFRKRSRRKSESS